MTNPGPSVAVQAQGSILGRQVEVLINITDVLNTILERVNSFHPMPPAVEKQAEETKAPLPSPRAKGQWMLDGLEQAREKCRLLNVMLQEYAG